MKRWIGLIVLCLVFQGVGLAQLIDAKSVGGPVVAQKGNALTVKENNHEVTLGLTDDTQIIEGSDFKTARDIQVGDRVTVIYRDKGNQKTALVVTITAKK